MAKPAGKMSALPNTFEPLSRKADRFLEAVLPPRASKIQQNEMRKAFVAGYHSGFYAVLGFPADGELSEEDEMAHVRALEAHRQEVDREAEKLVR